MSSNILLNYKPSDFYFYVSSQLPDQTRSSDSSNISCEELKPYDDVLWEQKCYTNTSPDYFLSCYQKELCKNRDYANTIIEYSNRYSGSDEKLLNGNDIYNNEFTKIVNLGIGILGLSLFLYYNQ